MFFKIKVQKRINPRVSPEEETFFVKIADQSETNILEECYKVLWKDMTEEIEHQFYKKKGFLIKGNMPKFVDFLIEQGMSYRVPWRDDLGHHLDLESEEYFQKTMETFFGENEIYRRYKIVGIFIAEECDGCRYGSLSQSSHWGSGGCLSSKTRGEEVADTI